ncbi:MAG: hypothetical protein ACKV2O_24080 [Acidimicrobiales bacterium]
MGAARRGRKGGRFTPRVVREPVIEDGPAELLADIFAAMNDPHPLGMLALTSAMLAAVDERSVSPFDRLAGREDQPDREDLLASLAEVHRPETTALLLTWAALTPNDVEAARIRRELAGRRVEQPRWIGRLGQTTVDRTVVLTHTLGDGEALFLGLTVGGADLTVAVYIDHNLGTLVKDATVAPIPIEELLNLAADPAHGADEVTIGDIAPAEARARIEEAIATTSATWPPFETESWPSCRAVVEWACRVLPAGGVGYQSREWSEAEKDALADRFFASAPGAALSGDDDHRSLTDTLLWFALGYGPGDPLRWSPSSVEIFLVDWFPRKVMADIAYKRKVTRVLRAFVAFCGAERGFTPALIAETLEAIDHWEPEFLRLIGAGKKRGRTAIGTAAGTATSAPNRARELDRRQRLEEAVGGAEALDALHDQPLPDEPFDWSTIPEGIAQVVGEVLAICDRACEELLAGPSLVEYRTACRRLLAQAAGVNTRGNFPAGARTDKTAAALLWAVGRANALFDGIHPDDGPALLVKDLNAHFGVTGSLSTLGQRLLRAAGFEPDFSYATILLGTDRLLVSTRRARLMAERDRLRSAAPTL